MFIKTFCAVILIGASVYFVLLYSFTMKTARNQTVYITDQDTLNNSQKLRFNRRSALDANFKDSLQETKKNFSGFIVAPSWIVQNSTTDSKKYLSTTGRFLYTEQPRKTLADEDSDRSNTSVQENMTSEPTAVPSSSQKQDATLKVLSTTITISLPTKALTLPGLIVELDSYLQDGSGNLSRDEPCPSFPKEGGRVPVQKDSMTLKDLESELRFVEKGGRWRPNQCQAKQKVAIVIPFRDRQEHLNIFLRHMHSFLKLQLLDYWIFVVEQAGEEKFNRGVLMNIGFAEALKVFNFTCVIFHDVDLIPEDTRNEYSCPTSPRHMSPAVDTLGYRLLYSTLFGGVEGFWKEHFVQANGFPNRYWGWGGEDDDLYERINNRRLRLTRPVHSIGRYTMLSHEHKENLKNPDRFHELRNALLHVESDGLNSLRYNILSSDELPFYTLITVQPHRS